MADNVLAMPGASISAEAIGKGADDSIVGRLEELLEHAKAGKIRAFAYAFVDRQNTTFEGWVSAQNEPTGHHLIASVSYLHHQIVVEKLSDPETQEEPR